MKGAAEAAMQAYATDLNGNLSDNVPKSPPMDNNSKQHLVTYVLSFGADGALHQAHGSFDATCAHPPTNDCMSGCDCPGSTGTWQWPDPDVNPLDDLWHAAVNGRGLFLHADNPQELIQKLLLIHADIQRRTGSAASVTTNSVQRQVGTLLYQGLYNSENWWGDVKAYPVDVSTGAIGGEEWSSRTQMNDDNLAYTARIGKVFTATASGTTLTPVDFDDTNAASFGLSSAYVNYLLGDSTNESATGLRPRTYTTTVNGVKTTHHFKLGDIAHSEPFYYKDVVYIGANDGMLHAIDANNGNELFAYVPNVVQSNLAAITQSSFNTAAGHRFYVDGSPNVYAFGTTGTRYLACGLGKGGKGVFCLKVDHAADNPTASNIFNWEYTDITHPTDADLGYVYGHVYVARSHAGTGTTAVFFCNGYANTSKYAVLYILNASDGTVLKKFNTNYQGSGVNGCNGMSSPALIDYDADGVIDYVYAGDLDGNLWKFDIRASDPADWSIAYGGHPMFTARDNSGHVQPITCEPDAQKHCDTYRSGIIVTFGTGEWLGQGDLASATTTQFIYGLYDWALDLSHPLAQQPVNGGVARYGKLLFRNFYKHRHVPRPGRREPFPYQYDQRPRR